MAEDEAKPQDALPSDENACAGQAVENGEAVSEEGAEENVLEISEEIREAIISDFLEEAAFEEFKQARPDLWMQVKRLSKILALQDETDDQCFESGTCFVHTNTPDYQGFCVKRVIEIDLESCMVVIEIYGEDELRPGVVMLPLESVVWFGFPTEKVPMDMRFRGFTFGQKSNHASAKQPGTAVFTRSQDGHQS